MREAGSRQAGVDLDSVSLSDLPNRYDRKEDVYLTLGLRYYSSRFVDPY